MKASAADDQRHDQITFISMNFADSTASCKQCRHWLITFSRQTSLMPWHSDAENCATLKNLKIVPPTKIVLLDM
jgi:hypothetical protein